MIAAKSQKGQCTIPSISASRNSAAVRSFSRARCVFEGRKARIWESVKRWVQVSEVCMHCRVCLCWPIWLDA